MVNDSIHDDGGLSQLDEDELEEGDGMDFEGQQLSFGSEMGGDDSFGR